MEEQEQIEPTDEDVEGHRRKATFQASEEERDEAEESDDVEAHAARLRPQSL